MLYAARLSAGLIAQGEVDWSPFFPRTTCAMRVCSIPFEGIKTLARDDIEGMSGPGPTRRAVGIIMADLPGESLNANNHHPTHNLGR